MAVRRLIISDLHFGCGDDLLSAPAALERIEPELAWADELVVNGDLFELVFATLREAVDAARPFLALVNRKVARVHYVLGNHDHHLVSLAGDERRFCEVLGTAPPAPFRVAPAERLLRSLCPSVEVVCPYPLCELDGMRITHGHYIAAHASSSSWRLMEHLAWSLTGSRSRPERLSVADYEALIAPLYELMYEMANLPSGKRAQEQFERWLGSVAAIAHAPQRASRQVVGFARSLAGRSEHHALLEPRDAPLAQVLGAIEAVCDNLDVTPGTVVIGHTHLPIDGAATPAGRYRIFNSGSWVWDRRIRNSPSYREHAWPGTVLRATGGEIELRGLLDDCDEACLRTMLGTEPAQRHSRRSAPKLAAAPHHH
ncbi:MAG: metallophosphoesterase [Solirubrobacteraceae bacterium]